MKTGLVMWWLASISDVPPVRLGAVVPGNASMTLSGSVLPIFSTAFIKQWHAFIKNDKRVTNDPMEATYIGFKMWTQAVMQAGTTDVDAVRQAMYGQKVKAPSGFTAVMNTNHHLSKPVYIGEIRPDGQFNVVWKTKGPIKADAWSKYIPESAKLTADWTFPWVCGNCEKPKFAKFE